MRMRVISLGLNMTAAPELVEILHDICGMEEMQKGSPATKEVIQKAQLMSGIMEGKSQLLWLAGVLQVIAGAFVVGIESEVKDAVKGFEVILNQACVKLVVSLQKYRLGSVRAEKLWGTFHKFSLQEGLQICRQCDSAINLNGSDVFWQLVMEKVLLSMFMYYETAAIAATSTKVATSERTLSSVEKNAIFYTAGHIVKKLICKYSRSSSSRAATYLDLLKSMGCKLAEKTSCTPDHCSKWIKIVDRGGLLHVSNTVYDLFMFLEYAVDEELTSIFKAWASKECRGRN